MAQLIVTTKSPRKNAPTKMIAKPLNVSPIMTTVPGMAVALSWGTSGSFAYVISPRMRERTAVANPMANPIATFFIPAL